MIFFKKKFRGDGEVKLITVLEHFATIWFDIIKDKQVYILQEKFVICGGEIRV